MPSPNFTSMETFKERYLGSIYLIPVILWFFNFANLGVIFSYDSMRINQAHPGGKQLNDVRIATIALGAITYAWMFIAMICQTGRLPGRLSISTNGVLGMANVGLPAAFLALTTDKDHCKELFTSPTNPDPKRASDSCKAVVATTSVHTAFASVFLLYVAYSVYIYSTIRKVKRSERRDIEIAE